MVNLDSKPLTLLEEAGLRLAEAAPMGPAEISDRRTAALRGFVDAGMPTSKHEEWKYISTRTLAETAYVPPPIANVSSAVLGEELESLPGPRIVLVNGFFSESLSRLSELQEGVRLESLRHALARSPELVLPHLGKVATLEGKLGSSNDSRFADLNFASFLDGVFVHLPKDTVADGLLQIIHVQSVAAGPFAYSARNLIVMEEGSEARLLEAYVGEGGAYLTNAVSEVVVGSRAMLEHTRLQQESPEATHLATNAIHQEADSTYNSVNASFGSRLGRLESNVWLNGEHTETRLDGVYVGNGEQVLANVTRIDHAKPNCHSFEVYKGILDDKAQGIFNGKIFVYEDAQKTDAKQTNQAVLLKPTATINTKPQLEIFADDVKCTHGATVGQMREDAMFYLRARGIPYETARNLLIYAFAAEVLERIQGEGVASALERILYAKLNQGDRLE